MELQYCHLCGQPHTFDTSVDSQQWNEVIRSRGLPDFLCLGCICSAFTDAGKPFTAKLYGPLLSGGTVTFDPRIGS